MAIIPTSLRGFLYQLYARRLRRSLQGKPKPKHVAMIIDGNRRWAKQLGLRDAAEGHAAGAAKMMEFLAWCDREGVQVVTLYLLSNDNLRNRSGAELSALIDIIEKLTVQIAENARWRVHHAGSTEHLPEGLCGTLRRVQQETELRRGMLVNLAVGYGGRSEIVDAMRRIVNNHAAEGGEVAALAEILTPDLIAEHLYTGGQPDPDLVIRTSGEQRLSDFMLWQSAHSEFYFVEALGPDLREVDFLRALRDFATRQRRFGQ